MELKEFKKKINEALILNKFIKKGSYYYSNNDDLIFVIGLQKSNFSNCYYINIGIVIKKLNPTLESPRDVDGDIRARFSFEKNGKQLDCFEIQDPTESDEGKLPTHIQVYIDAYIRPVTSLDRLKWLLKTNPVMLYQTTLRAKHFLGFKE